jgi:DNA-binding NarL/FixJ family response regulator
MAKTKITHLFCFDDHRTFSEDIRKRFSDISKYKVLSFSLQQELLKHLEEEKEHGFCKVAILSLHETKEQYEMADHLTREIKKTDPGTGLILLCPGDKTDEIKKVVKFNIDSYIPRNDNAILRTHNAVKKLISEHNLEIFRKRRNFSLYFLLAFLLLSAILILVARLKMPIYF